MIGDAVHATIPQLGSGAALAIEDAVVLAEEVSKNIDVAQAFENYMQRRYERCKLVIDVSNTLAEWEQKEWRGEPLPEGANAGALMGKTLASLAAPI
jgi:2-polyprenyl-6-methoxyphenol hydroxylase-like FAD-dependent oxidoreductase